MFYKKGCKSTNKYEWFLSCITHSVFFVCSIKVTFTQAHTWYKSPPCKIDMSPET